MPNARAWFALLLRYALCLGLCSAGVAAAQTVDAQRADQVKAAYLLNFLRYTQWPADTFSSPESPYFVTVLGTEEFAVTLQDMADARSPINGRPVHVQRLQLPRPAADGALGSVQRAQFVERLQESHLLFIGKNYRERADEVLAYVRDYPVLTVGDADHFATSGGMLGLVPLGRGIALDANPSAIRRADLAVSAKVLKLAHLVGEERW